MRARCCTVKQFKRWLQGASGTVTEKLDSTLAHPILSMTDLVDIIVRHIDVGTGMNARCVNKFWRDAVKEAGLEPLGGFHHQQKLQRLLQTEHAVWTPQKQAMLYDHVSRQPEITNSMRVMLVNWLIEMHCKYDWLTQRCLHLAVRIVDHYLATVVVKRRHYQLVGVTAFRIACRSAKGDVGEILDVAVLSRMTDHTSSPGEIEAKERDILGTLDAGFRDLPTMSNFLPRLCAAAKLNIAARASRELTREHSIALYFLDIASLNSTIMALRPSLVTAAAIMCTLRVLGRKDWSPQLEYYSTHRRDLVAPLAEILEAAAQDAQAPAITLKYTRKRFGGDGENGSVQGCLHVISAYRQSRRVV